MVCPDLFSPPTRLHAIVAVSTAPVLLSSYPHHLLPRRCPCTAQRPPPLHPRQWPPIDLAGGTHHLPHSHRLVPALLTPLPLRRQLTREQLLKGLQVCNSSHLPTFILISPNAFPASLASQILGPVSAPLPPDLPPSPPASRESSPALGLKRRHDSDPENGRSKKPRVAPPSSSSRPRTNSQSRAAPAATPSSSRHEPSEDGEVKEESSSSHTSLPTGFPSFMPVRRPRRGDNIPTSDWDAVYEKCFANARKLRFSALARVAAAHPSTSKEYRPLRNPPHPNSSYAKHSLLMARLELIDSALHFVYGLWCKDYSVRTCYRAAWRTVDAFMKPTKSKVAGESHDEREKAFIGLL